MHNEADQYPTENIVLILSRLPEFLRESMMRSRLQELSAMGSEVREKFVGSVLIGLSLAEKDGLRKVIRSWLRAVLRLESNEILTIFAAFINIYKENPTLCKRDYFTVLFEAYQSLEENERVVLRDYLIEVIFNQYLGRQITLTLPKKVRSALML